MPLLSYCGVQCSANVLMSHKENLGDYSLHPAEDKYLQQMLDNPRSLKHRCRDVLRKHLQGRKIHRYAEVIDMPKQIKDFILFKPVLKILTNDLFKFCHAYCYLLVNQSRGKSPHVSNGPVMRKHVLCHMRTPKTTISLRIRAV